MSSWVYRLSQQWAKTPAPLLSFKAPVWFSIYSSFSGSISFCISQRVLYRYVWAAALWLYSVLMRGLLCRVSQPSGLHALLFFSLLLLFLFYSAHNSHTDTHRLFLFGFSSNTDLIAGSCAAPSALGSYQPSLILAQPTSTAARFDTFESCIYK